MGDLVLLSLCVREGEQGAVIVTSSSLHVREGGRGALVVVVCGGRVSEDEARSEGQGEMRMNMRVTWGQDEGK